MSDVDSPLWAGQLTLLTLSDYFVLAKGDAGKKNLMSVDHCVHAKGNV